MLIQNLISIESVARYLVDFTDDSAKLGLMLLNYMIADRSKVFQTEFTLYSKGSFYEVAIKYSNERYIVVLNKL